MAGVAFLLIRVAVGVVFLLSSVPKILEPYPFFLDVGAYALVGPRTALWVAVVLPWLELLLGVCLIAGVATRGAMLVSAALAGVFVVAIGSVLARGMTVSCGCFGGGGEGGGPIGYWTLGRAALLLCVTLVGCWLSFRRTRSPAGAQPPVSQQTVPELAPGVGRAVPTPGPG